VGDPTAAEDVFQSTFLQVHLKCEQFAAGRTVRPWLYTIATNLAIDALRRRRRSRCLRIDWPCGSDDAPGPALSEWLCGGDPAPAEQLDRQEQHRWVRKAVDHLPEHLRSPILLIYFQGLKYRQAAEVLSVPVGTVKSRMHAALERLKRTAPYPTIAGVPAY
jgi:RNA polymerase sigma-70 factor (ECF subfamily)